ncbi:MAG TPA: MBL fold metallo-hydrolase [Candidatus Omnitrophica bacterium]|nr:MBL fold metallo-hydrolase [Candidatus Omnitrophota bacterium]
MDELELKTFTLGELFTNTYLVFEKEKRRGFLVDVPFPTKEIKEFIQREELKINFILLTHGHFDHIQGLKDFSLPVFIHQKDYSFLEDADLNGSNFFGYSIKISYKKIKFYNHSLFLGNYPIEIFHTPGHTPGSVAIKIQNWLFSGDTIFFDSIGRTDIPLGSYDLLINSIKEKILKLPLSTLIYPGHGKPTTVERELKDNPFLV